MSVEVGDAIIGTAVDDGMAGIGVWTTGFAVGLVITVAVAVSGSATNLVWVGNTVTAAKGVPGVAVWQLTKTKQRGNRGNTW